MTGEAIPELVVTRANELVDAYLRDRQGEGAYAPTWAYMGQVAPKLEAILNTNRENIHALIDTLLYLHWATLTVAADRLDTTPHELWEDAGKHFTTDDDGEGVTPPTDPDS